MNLAVEQMEKSPWYRSRWPWLLMSGPAVVIVAGVYTAWLAVNSDDGLVADDYYKKGLAINQTLARVEQARLLGLSAHLTLARERLSVQLNAEDVATLPKRVRLVLVHPTRKVRDRAALLEVREGMAIMDVSGLASGHWQIDIEDESGAWRLTGSMSVPDQSSIDIAPAPAP